MKCMNFVHACTVTHNMPTLLVVQFNAQEGGGRISGDLCKILDYTPTICCCIHNTLPPSTKLFVQLQVQREGHLLIAQKAKKLAVFQDRLNGFAIAKLTLWQLSLILVKDLLVSSIYTFTGESKRQ